MQLPRTIEQAGAMLRRAETSCLDLTRAFLERIHALQPQLNAFIAVTASRALDEAAARDAELRSGVDRGPLHGIPIVHKDCFDVLGAPTSAGAALYRSRVPARDAVVVHRLAEAGAIVLGKTNMNELAAGTSGRNVHFGDVHNPWDPDLSPGGSSSGTAAAIAAGLCLGGTGTDAGGSIRIPAACNGLVGLRPTFGLVPVSGCIPRSRTFDTAGPLARTVHDCAVLFQAMTAPEGTDHSRHRAGSWNDAAPPYAGDLGGVRLGIVDDFSLRDVDPEVQACLRHTLDAAANAGVRIETIRVAALSSGPTLGELMDIMLYEFRELMAPDLAGRTDLAEVLGPVVRANLDAARAVSKERYGRLVALREAAVRDVDGALAGCDALVTPVLPTPTPRLDAPPATFDRGRELMLPVSFAGVPAISVPCGRSRAGTPIGMQLVGRTFGEARLLCVAERMERLVRGWEWSPKPAKGHFQAPAKD